MESSCSCTPIQKSVACACLSEFITASREMWKISSAIGAGSGISSMSR
jgi:hypothetical protein